MRRADKPRLVGNLSSRRDYLGVRDVARAYAMLVRSGRHDTSIYNVSSDRSQSDYEVLECLSGAMGIAVPPLEVDPKRLRPTGADEIVGSSATMREEFGWEPGFSIERTIADFVRGVGDE